MAKAYHDYVSALGVFSPQEPRVGGGGLWTHNLARSSEEPCKTHYTLPGIALVYLYLVKCSGLHKGFTGPPRLADIFYL